MGSEGSQGMNHVDTWECAMSGTPQIVAPYYEYAYLKVDPAILGAPCCLRGAGMDKGHKAVMPGKTRKIENMRTISLSQLTPLRY